MQLMDTGGMVARRPPGTRSATAAFALALALALGVTAARAQTFNSGSTGADGAFDLSSTPSGTTVVLDPVALGIDPERDNVFHFTTITIPTGVTVRLSNTVLGGPVFWLATGAVLINGTVDANGVVGHTYTPSAATRTAAEPGAGGFPGGVGGNSGGSAAPQPGAGPNGGGINGPDGVGFGGAFAGNQFLVPLFGGSGGGGGTIGGAQFDWGAGGGGGGGALLIASSVSIIVNGTIAAEGGAGGLGHPNCVSWTGGSGSGGAIRLVAPLLRGTGTLAVRGFRASGSCRSQTDGGAGRIRLEAFRHEYTGQRLGNWTTGSPVSTFLPPGATTVRVTTIAGVPVPANPTGSFEMPDVTINEGTAVPVEIEARLVPPGTVVKLHLFSLEGADQIVSAPPLAGTLELSAATASVTFPPGFTRGFARAVWR